MRPLKLNVEELKVDSFQTGEGAKMTGTVRGHVLAGEGLAASVVVAYAGTCGGGATANPTLCASCDSCYDSCWGTCGGGSCSGCFSAPPAICA